jgi:hypothetical protein
LRLQTLIQSANSNHISWIQLIWIVKYYEYNLLSKLASLKTYCYNFLISKDNIQRLLRLQNLLIQSTYYELSSINSGY